MRRQRRHPLDERLGWRRPERAAVEEQVALAVPPQEIALLGDVDCARPPMCVNRHRFARRDPNLENSHALVFKHQLVMPRRRDHGVQRIGPGPFLLLFQSRFCAQGGLSSRDAPTEASRWRTRTRRAANDRCRRPGRISQREASKTPRRETPRRHRPQSSSPAAAKRRPQA